MKGIYYANTNKVGVAMLIPGNVNFMTISIIRNK